MTVHSIIRFIYILPVCIVIISCQQREKWDPYRPNIIFLLTDDQRDNTLGIMGHPWVKTPNLDQLVQDGIRFANTYIAEPTCSPSRVAIFTGMHERKNGIGFTSSYQLTEEQWERTYPALLRGTGYYTGFVGKFGVEYYTFRGRASEKFDFWRGHDGWTKFFPKDFQDESCIPYHDAGEDIITPIMGESINMFFNSLPANKPFCLSVSFSVPHGSQTTSMYTECDNWHAMMTPANQNPRLKGHPFYDTLYRKTPFDIPEECATDPYRFIPQNVMDQDGGRSKTYEYSYNPVSCREHHIRYYQTITGFDRVIGGLIKSLEEREFKEHTIIIFASDHGLLMGEYGMGGKALLYDLTSKIPCFIIDPAIPDQMRGKTLDHLVSSLDITATILDYAGIPIPEDMEGKSLVPLMANQKLPWREEIFLENLYTGRDNPFCEGIRLGNWKYIRMYDGKMNYLEEDVDFRDKKPDFEQLFNLEKDPGEYHNLIELYEGSAILQDIRAKCMKYSNDLNGQRSAYKQKSNVQVRNVGPGV
jgi:arylsulfatase A-like enzyme